MIDMISNVIGEVPAQYEWVLGVMAIVLFTFVTHIVFEVIGTFFNMFGGGKHGRSY